jgi:hypothetical protein
MTICQYERFFTVSPPAPSTCVGCPPKRTILYRGTWPTRPCPPCCCHTLPAASILPTVSLYSRASSGLVGMRLYEISTFQKETKLGCFFFLVPILDLCRNFCTNYFWENLQISRTIWRMNFSKVGMNFSNSCVFRVRHHEPHFRSLNVLMRSMCRRKSVCVVAKGEGQPGVQSE